MRHLVELTVRMRLPLLLLCLALTGVFLFQARNAKLHDDPNEWLPADNPVGKINKVLQEKFGGGNLLTIQVTVPDGDILNPDTLAKVKRITREVLLTWGVIPYNVLSVAALQVRYLKATDDFLDNTPLMDEVPTTPAALKKIEAFATYMETFPQVAGTVGLPVYIKLMSQFMRGGNAADFRLPDDRAEVGYYMEMYAQDVPGSFDAVVDYTFKQSFFSVYTSDTSHATVAPVMRAAEEYARTKFNDSTLTATVGGGAVAIAEGFNRDIAKWLVYATAAATLLSFLVLVPMSGSLVGPALLLLPLVMGSVIWLVLMQLSGIEINSNTTTGMAIASGVGVDAELYLLGRFREEYGKHGDFRLALKQGFISVREALTFSYLGLIAGCWVLIPIPLYVGYMGYGMGIILGCISQTDKIKAREPFTSL